MSEEEIKLHSFTRHDLEARDERTPGASPPPPPPSSSSRTIQLKGSSGAYWSASRCCAVSGGGDENEMKSYQLYLGIGKTVYRATRSCGIGKVPREGEELFKLGKDDVVLPSESKAGLEVTNLQAFAHRHEIQSMATWNASSTSIGSHFVASVDSTGSLCVCEFQNHQSIRSDDEKDEASQCPERSYQAQPLSCSAMEVGWAGVALGRQQPTKAVVARHFPKDLNVFDGDMLVRTIKTIQNPTAIQMLEDEVYVVAETNKIGVYDLRVDARQGCVQCLQATDTVTCLASSPSRGSTSSDAAVASGIGRTVAVWDVRKWNAFSRFTGLRQEACGIKCLNTKANALCVASMNGEIKVIKFSPGAAVVSAKQKSTTFKSHANLRGDSRWIGLSAPVSHALWNGAAADTCIGLGVSGGLYSVTLS